MSSLVGEEYFARPPRRTVSWRQRLARFLRGERRRSKASKVPPISKAPPRLGPIGEDLLAYDTGNKGLVNDFSSLKFDDRGSLKDFKLSFDITDTKSFAPAPKDSRQKRPPRSQPTDSSRKHGQAPSLDLPKLDAEEGGFLDTWLKQSVKKEDQENSMAKPNEPQKKVKSMLDVGSPPKTKAPLAEQFMSTKAKEPERSASAIGRSMASGTNSSATSYVDYAQPMKRKVGEQDSLSAPKVRSTDRKSVTSVTMLPPTSFPADRASISSSTQPSTYNTSTYNTNRYSLDLSSDLATSRSLSTTSKRLSTGSMYSQQAQRIDYQRPLGSAKIVDPDAESIASTTSVPSRRFEVKSSSLLTPVTKTSADAAAAAVSQTISRINSNSYIGAVPTTSVTSMPSSHPRGLGADGRRSVTDTVRTASQKRADDDNNSNSSASSSRNPSRRFSQPAMRNSYVEQPSPPALSRTPTPEAQQLQQYGMPPPPPEARPRRPSSRLSDRMSWLKDLDDASKNTGRDFVFRKLEGSVAAKLAAFETKGKDEGAGAKTVGGGTPVLGRSRTNSNASRVPSSELYGIESSRLSRRTTAQDGELKPGNVADVVGEGFKKRLESLTGNLANKVQEQSGKETAPESAIRGPANLAQAKKHIPQDVLDLIILSGVDQELAINEYLQRGTMGKSNNWDHEELMKQLEGPETQSLLKEERQSPKTEVETAKSVIPADVNTAKEDVKEEKVVLIKKEVPVEEVIPSPVKEEKMEEELQAQQIPVNEHVEKKESTTTPSAYSTSQNGKPKGMSFVVNSNGDVTGLNASVTSNKNEDEQRPTTASSFNAASLPSFGA